VHITALVAVALALGGMAWILALSTLNSLYQLSLPHWVKARGMSFYLVVFQGGSAIGSVAFGLAAQHASLAVALLIATAGLALGPLAGLRYRFQAIPPQEFLPSGDMPAPNLTDVPRGGPVMVTIEYLAQPGREDELLAALQDARFSRRRTGASSWRAWQDSTRASRPGQVRRDPGDDRSGPSDHRHALADALRQRWTQKALIMMRHGLPGHRPVVSSSGWNPARA
jgi:hypothetical protein